MCRIPSCGRAIPKPMKKARNAALRWPEARTHSLAHSHVGSPRGPATSLFSSRDHSNGASRALRVFLFFYFRYRTATTAEIRHETTRTKIKRKCFLKSNDWLSYVNDRLLIFNCDIPLGNAVQNGALLYFKGAFLRKYFQS